MNTLFKSYNNDDITMEDNKTTITESIQDNGTFTKNGTVTNILKRQKRVPVQKVKTSQEKSMTKSVIDSIYEAYSKGEITLEQREEQIQLERDKNYFESMIADDCLTPFEMFESVRDSLYVKSSKGELSEDKREELICKARGIYLA